MVRIRAAPHSVSCFLLFSLFLQAPATDSLRCASDAGDELPSAAIAPRVAETEVLPYPIFEADLHAASVAAASPKPLRHFSPSSPPAAPQQSRRLAPVAAAAVRCHSVAVRADTCQLARRGDKTKYPFLAAAHRIFAFCSPVKQKVSCTPAGRPRRCLTVSSAC